MGRSGRQLPVFCCRNGYFYEKEDAGASIPIFVCGRCGACRPIMKRHRGRPRPQNPPQSAPHSKVPKKRRAVRLVADVLELPAGIAESAHIELSGNREAVVEGCVGVLEYDENIVCVSTGKTVVRFLGSGLTLRSLSEDTVVIRGTIISVEFS